MKPKWVLYLLLSGVLLSCDSDDYPNADIPSVAINHFRASYPEASEVNWEQVKDHYEVDFELYGRDTKVQIQTSGDIIQEKQEIPYEELPPEVKSSLEKEFGKKRIEDPEMITAGERRYYQMEIAGFFFDKEMVVDKQGVKITSVPYWD